MTGFLMSARPDPAPPVVSTYRWGAVIDTSPLTVQLDGDTLPLALIPDCLCDPLSLGVGDRVWTQLYGRRVVVHGAQGGGTGPSTLSNEQAKRLNPTVGGNTNSVSFVDWPNAGGGPVAITHVKRLASSVIVLDVTATGWVSTVGQVDYGVQVDGGTDHWVVRSYHNTTTDHRQWAAKLPVTGVAAGSHTWRLRARTSGVTLSFDSNDTFSLSIREVPA